MSGIINYDFELSASRFPKTVVKILQIFAKLTMICGDEMRDALLSWEMGGSVGSAPAVFGSFLG